MGLLLAIDRRIPDNVADLRTGTWNKATYCKADGLFGKVMGIVGLGEIGFAVAERASRVRARPSERSGRIATRRPRSGSMRSASSSSTRSRSSWRRRTSSRSTCPPLRRRSRCSTPALLGPDEGGRDPAEHVSRERRGRGRAPRCARDPRAPRGSRRVSRRARLGLDGVVLEARATSPRRRDASHRRVDRAGAEGGRRRGRRDHRGVRPGRDRELREPRAHPARDPHPPRPALRSRRACSRACSTSCDAAS